MWLGVVLYVDDTSTAWMRAVQLIFGVTLAAWAVRRTTQMITKT